MLGFIGLGAMGTPMASRLVTGGHQLGVYNRTASKTVALADRGARVFETPADLATEADVVFTMLADDAAVEQMLLGASGVIAAARPGATLIDLSSVHPETSRVIATAARRRGVDMLDAAVSGSTPQAEDGSLVMFIGGERAVYERCQPLLQVLAGSIFYLGPNGSGSTMKLVVNGLLGAGMQALAEALALGQRAGLPRDTLIDVLDQTTILTPGQKHKLQNVRSDTYPVEFALRLMWKDFGNVLRLAEQHAVPMPATAAAQQAFAMEQGRNVDEDFSAVIRRMEELAGVASRAPSPSVTSNGLSPISSGPPSASSDRATAGAQPAHTGSNPRSAGSQLATPGAPPATEGPRPN